VVFHILQRKDGTGNIKNDQILSQVEILNEDFGALPGTPGDGGAVSEDTHIRFVLAGVDRHVNDEWFDDPLANEEEFKQALHWDAEKYLNIYTVSTNDFALGWAYLPQDMAGEPSFDGVVLDVTTVGRNGPAPPYNQGRTATHEVGHYLGLRHTFYPNNGGTVTGVCEENGWSAGDLIQSTPAHPKPTTGCPNFEQICADPTPPAARHNINNYMNYTNDTCLFYFDIQQANRSVCSIVNYRPKLFHTVSSKAVILSSIEGFGGGGSIHLPKKPIAKGSQFYLGGIGLITPQKNIPSHDVRARVSTNINGQFSDLAIDFSNGLSPAFIKFTLPKQMGILYSIRGKPPDTLPYSGFVIYVPVD